MVLLNIYSGRIPIIDDDDSMVAISHYISVYFKNRGSIFFFQPKNEKNHAGILATENSWKKFYLLNFLLISKKRAA